MWICTLVDEIMLEPYESAAAVERPSKRHHTAEEAQKASGPTASSPAMVRLTQFTRKREAQRVLLSTVQVSPMCHDCPTDFDHASLLELNRTLDE